jgi:thioredoxin reductase (NADPH)
MTRWLLAAALSLALSSRLHRYIKSLNFQYRVALRDANVKYINGLGEFESAHAIKVSHQSR